MNNSLKNLFLTTVIGAGVIVAPNSSIAQTNTTKRHVIKVLTEVPDSMQKIADKAFGKTPAPRPAKRQSKNKVKSNNSPVYQLQNRLDQLVQDMNTLSSKKNGRSNEFWGQVVTVRARDKHPAEALLYTIKVAKRDGNDSTKDGWLTGIARKIRIEDTNGHVQIFLKKFDYSKDKLPNLSLAESEKLRGDPANRARSTDKGKGPFYYNEISVETLKNEVRAIEERVNIGRESYRRSH